MGLFNNPVTGAGGGLFVGEQYSSSQTSTSLTIISAFDPVVLTQDNTLVPGGAVFVPGDLDLVVNADHVSIAGPLSLPQRNVTIVARVLEGTADSAGKPASIAVDGIAGAVPPLPAPPPAQTGPGTAAQQRQSAFDKDTPATGGSLGAGGGQGDQGATGGNGGTIKISAELLLHPERLTLSAAGGTGGKGRQGQTGGEGGVGGDGFIRAYQVQGLAGAQGGQGGPGGTGGVGGTGGNGGAVDVTTIVAPEGSVSIVVGAGQTGPGGDAGAGGAGGPGGQSPGDAPSQAPTGPQGTGGTPGPGGQPGSDGTSHVALIGYDALGTTLSDDGGTAQLQMTLQRAKLSYLTSNPADDAETGYHAAATRLLFLTRVTANAQGLSLIHAEAAALLARMMQKLDFYGNAPNWVPMGSYGTFSDTLTQMVTELKSVESAVQAYWRDYADQQKSVGNLQTALNSGSAQLASLGTQVTNAQSTALDLQNVVIAGNVAVANQHTVLMARIHDLREELSRIARNSGGPSCALETAIKALNFTAAVSGNAEIKKASQVAGAVQAVIPSGGSGVTEADVHRVDVLGSEVQSLPEAVDVAYNSPAGPIITSQDPNAYKLLLEQKKFDQMVAPFVDVAGAAQPAIDAMHLYVHIVQQRNADVLRYNAEVNHVNSLNAQIGQTKNQINQAQNAINQTNPRVPAMNTFVSRLYEDAKWTLIRQFYLSFRALSHWSLNTDDAAFFNNIGPGLDSLDQITAGTLASYQITMQGMWTETVERFGTAPQQFPVSGSGVTLSITNPDVIASLKSNYEAWFIIPPVYPDMDISASPFAHKANVRITFMRPWLNGAVARASVNDGYLQATLTHMGREIVVDTSGHGHWFTHAPVKKDFEYQPANRQNVREVPNFGYYAPEKASTYALLGPFTTWHLKVDRSSADLSQLTSIDMEVAGTSYAFTSALRQASPAAAPRRVGSR